METRTRPLAPAPHEPDEVAFAHLRQNFARRFPAATRCTLRRMMRGWAAAGGDEVDGPPVSGG